MIKLIIFDWDDVFTLGATLGYFKCYHETLLELGIYLDREEEKKRILKKWGKHAPEVLQELLEENKPLLGRACDIYERILFGNTFIDSIRLVEGSRELLERLSESYILAISTGVNPRLLREKIMPKFNIPNIFSHIISVYDVKDPSKVKPHPYMLRQILKTQKVRAKESIFVGDAKTDVEMANNAGVIPVVVLTGHLKEAEARNLKVKYVIDDVTYLEKVLSELNKKIPN